MVRIRLSVSICFALSLLIACYLGFFPISLKHDKVVHFLTFLVLTVEFYYLFDTQNRAIKTLRYVTLFACTFVGAIFSEFIQSLINPARKFDVYDIYSNIAGSLLGLGLATVFQLYLLKKAKNQRIHNRLNSNDYSILENEASSSAPRNDTEEDYVNLQMKDIAEP